MRARGRAATSTTRRCASSTSTRRCRAPGSNRREPQLHALHPRHDRQAQGRAARHRRLRGGAGRSMKHIFCGQPGETYFSTSDIGWVVGHSYIVYGPLIAGMATHHVRGPADPARRRHLVAAGREVQGDARCSASPTAIRVLKKQDPALLKKHDLSSPARAVPRRRAARRADRALDRRGARHAGHRQLLADRNRLADPDASPTASRTRPSKFGSPACRCTATTCKLLDEATGEELTAPNEKGVVVIDGAAAARLHADRVGRRRALRQDLLVEHSRASWSTPPSTGASATTTATTSSSAAPTT